MFQSTNQMIYHYTPLLYTIIYHYILVMLLSALRKSTKNWKWSTYAQGQHGLSDKKPKTLEFAGSNCVWKGKHYISALWGCKGSKVQSFYFYLLFIRITWYHQWVAQPIAGVSRWSPLRESQLWAFCQQTQRGRWRVLVLGSGIGIVGLSGTSIVRWI